MINYTDLIGTPFVNEGRDSKKGLDCYGLVKEVYRRYGIELPEYTLNYDEFEKIDALIRNQKTNPIWKKADDAEPPVPSIVCMSFGVPKGIINHTGVYIGDGKMIHTRAKIGVCVDRVDSPAWRRVIDSYYTYTGGDK